MVLADQALPLYGNREGSAIVRRAERPCLGLKILAVAIELAEPPKRLVVRGLRLGMGGRAASVDGPPRGREVDLGDADDDAWRDPR